MPKLKLLHKDGNTAHVGDLVTNFRGEVATIKSIHPPKHIGSTGHITTDLGFHFVTVYGMEFVNIDTFAKRSYPNITLEQA